MAPTPHSPSIEADLTMPADWRGWGWPETITVKWSPEDDPDVTVVLNGAMTNEGPILTSLQLTGPDLRPNHLRLPFLTVLRQAFATAAHGPREGGGYSRKAGVVMRVPVGAGRPIDVTSARQRLPELADLYKKTPHGKKTKTISDHFGITIGYTRTLISDARRAGLLE